MVLPGGGIRKVPPHSPLIRVLDHVATFESDSAGVSLGLQQQVRREALGQIISIATAQLESMVEIRQPSQAPSLANTEVPSTG